MRQQQDESIVHSPKRYASPKAPLLGVHVHGQAHGAGQCRAALLQCYKLPLLSTLQVLGSASPQGGLQTAPTASRGRSSGPVQPSSA